MVQEHIPPGRGKIGIHDGVEVLTVMVDTGQVCETNVARVAYSDR